MGLFDAFKFMSGGKKADPVTPGASTTSASDAAAPSMPTAINSTMPSTAEVPAGALDASIMPAAPAMPPAPAAPSAPSMPMPSAQPVAEPTATPPLPPTLPAAPEAPVDSSTTPSAAR